MPFAGFFSNNPLFAWGLLVLTVLGVIKGKEELDKAQGRRDAERRAEIRARRVQTEIRKRTNEKSAQVERARESAPSGIDHSERVPDDLKSIIFGDRGSGGGD